METKITSRSQGEFLINERCCLILVLDFSLALQVSELSPPSHFHLVSISFQRLLERSSTSPPIPLKSHKSRTRLVHHLIQNYSIYSTIPKPGATDSPCQAPGLGSFIANFIPFQVEVRNGHVHFQCFGKGLWTKTMANHVKPENFKCHLRQRTAMSTTQLKSTNS